MNPISRFLISYLNSKALLYIYYSNSVHSFKGTCKVKPFNFFSKCPYNPLSEIFMTLLTAESTDTDTNARLGEPADSGRVI